MRALVLALVLVGAAATASDTDDWPKYGRNLSNHRYSPLTQIDRGNVAQLQLAWSYRTARKATFQTSPIVVEGTMYLTTPFNDVIALDAADGREIWRYRHQLRQRKTCCGPANRGPAVSEDKVFSVTIDARLIALDRRTGRLLWDMTLADPEAADGEELSSLLGVAGLEGAFAGTGVSAAVRSGPRRRSMPSSGCFIWVQAIHRRRWMRPRAPGTICIPSVWWRST